MGGLIWKMHTNHTIKLNNFKCGGCNERVGELLGDAKYWETQNIASLRDCSFDASNVLDILIDLFDATLSFSKNVLDAMNAVETQYFASP